MNAEDLLNKEISDVFGLLGVLLVFVIAFYTYLLTQAEILITRAPPTVKAERRGLIAQLTTTRRLLSGLAVGTALILALLVPLLGRTVHGLLSKPDHFPTSQIGLVLVCGFLIVLLVAIGWSRNRVTTRITEIPSAKDPDPG
jgi:sterol desaturase/sphingolipid hydroxylase (fatty acid hydroxylase superfamily)